MTPSWPQLKGRSRRALQAIAEYEPRNMVPHDGLLLWLQALNLGKYHSILAEQSVGLEEIAIIGEAGLVTLGLPLGPRRKIQARQASLVLSLSSSTANSSHPPQVTASSHPPQVTASKCIGADNGQPVASITSPTASSSLHQLRSTKGALIVTGKHQMAPSCSETGSGRDQTPWALHGVDSTMLSAARRTELLLLDALYPQGRRTSSCYLLPSTMKRTISVSTPVPVSCTQPSSSAKRPRRASGGGDMWRAASDASGEGLDRLLPDFRRLVRCGASLLPPSQQGHECSLSFNKVRQLAVQDYVDEGGGLPGRLDMHALTAAQTAAPSAAIQADPRNYEEYYRLDGSAQESAARVPASAVDPVLPAEQIGLTDAQDVSRPESRAAACPAAVNFAGIGSPGSIPGDREQQRARIRALKEELRAAERLVVTLRDMVFEAEGEMVIQTRRTHQGASNGLASASGPVPDRDDPRILRGGGHPAAEQVVPEMGSGWGGDVWQVWPGEAQTCVAVGCPEQDWQHAGSAGGAPHVEEQGGDPASAAVVRCHELELNLSESAWRPPPVVATSRDFGDADDSCPFERNVTSELIEILDDD